MEIRKPEIELLEITTRDLLKEIVENDEAHQVKQKAFQFLINNDEEVQIQIVITRNSFDFLDDFQTEIMNGY